MTVAAIVIAACLAVAAVVFVARPFLLDPERRDEARREPDAAELERIRLLEERDRALAALKELEFDHRTGKVSDADYRELVGSLRREAAAALAALGGQAKRAANAPRNEAAARGLSRGGSAGNAGVSGRQAAEAQAAREARIRDEEPQGRH